MEIAIIADDLTGACDTAVQFARAGYRSAVAFGGVVPAGFPEADVVAVDTDTRSLPPEQAYRKVLEAGSRLRATGLLYKKLDSTLRGPVAAELAAALAATGLGQAILAPAFPATGRTTVDGVQLLHGRPVHETGLAPAPADPVCESSLPALLSEPGLGEATVLSRGELSDLPARELHAAVRRGAHVVADATARSHLEALVRAVPEPSRVLWAGSAGLAQALASVYPGPGRESASPAQAARVLAVAGSASRVTREQCERLAEEPGVTPVVLGASAGAVEEATGAARKALSGGGHVVLRPEDAPLYGDVRRESGRIVSALAEVAAALSEEDLFDALVLTGGDTAVNVARRLGAQGILLETELEAGVPAGTLIGSRPCRVVTKAGAFGSRETMLRALRSLTERESQR